MNTRSLRLTVLVSPFVALLLIASAPIDHIFVTVNSFSITEGQSYSSNVATIQVDNNIDVAHLEAFINWGDGSAQTQGTITGPDVSTGAYDVNATHTYADAGTFTVTVTADDQSHVTGHSATASGTATVDDAPLEGAGVPFTATAGTSFNGIVATFTDANSLATPDDFTATIDWGDGSQSAGTVTGGGGGAPLVPGGFNVSGTHTYSSPGLFSATIVVQDAGGSSIQASASATVLPGGIIGADLQMAKLSSRASASTGDLVQYTLTATNNGPFLAASVTITDTLPAGVTFVSASPACTGTTTVTCSFATINIGSSASAQITVRVVATSGTVTNTATAATITGDPNPLNNSSSAAFAVGSAPEGGATLSPLGLLILGVLLAASGWFLIRLR